MTIQVAQLQDPREPTQRQHEDAMRRGSQEMIAELWAKHELIMRLRTGRLGQ